MSMLKLLLSQLGYRRFITLNFLRRNLWHSTKLFVKRLEDYRDFLRVRALRLWDKECREARFVRRLGAMKNASYETYGTYIETRPPKVVANILICLIHQTNYLLDQQLRQLEQAFLKEGGLRERMTRSRLSERSKIRRR